MGNIIKQSEHLRTFEKQDLLKQRIMLIKNPPVTMILKVINSFELDNFLLGPSVPSKQEIIF